MKEEFLHFIWSQGLFKRPIVSDTGETIEVIDPGTHNKDAGPDFLNARIKIDSTIWAGNVEVHTESVNWTKHKHHTDAAYNSVILHVVNTYNQQTINSIGRKIPAIVLDFEPALYDKYLKITGGKLPVPCHHDLKQVDNFIVEMWLNTLIIERLEVKTDFIKTILFFTKNNWEETFYISLARNFGFKTNALPFELLAKSLPVKIISKYKHNLIQLEALLFGQAGFFESEPVDQYTLSLKKEYEYLQKVHQLKPLENHIWKFLRLRPANFPTIRIAQLASLIHQSQHLFSKTIEAKNIEELYGLYDCAVSEYWNTHFSFGKETKREEKYIGKSSVFGIFINTVIPFLFLYGKLHGNATMIDKSIAMLEQLPAEKNHIIDSWAKEKVIVNNALKSQALLQLTNYYCNHKNCLYCQIGNTIIRNRQ